MHQPLHIILCGARGAGKSFLLQRLLRHSTRPVYGFVTKRAPCGTDGFYPIYIHSAGAPERRSEPANLVGTCNELIHNTNSDIFNTLGASYLDAQPGGLIVMDELGFMESRSERFKLKVLEALDGDIPVLSAVKARYDVPFLNAVRAHENVRAFDVTPENRDKLYETLFPSVEAWNRMP